ncbi:IclR family transcriptional regulator [Nocardioides mangrovicus]|uniref:IclR family transcriptional regulator n=1 Tax=Nocardioides mangrovicus TaxID=2478913 RepID=A0A3L8NXA7_9ACTN|nr:IclR family transcriptional regulator [Nocardioides mangrovicus]RLV47815.1 IclR family transcriptional regulator [Nocardioides mangrovicus]
MTEGSPTGTQAIDRAAMLVATVVRADEPLSFVEVQDTCGLPKSTTSRLLTALERTELVERNDAGSYVAGPLFWLYAARHDPWEEWVRVAQPTLELVGEDTGETVNLAVARGDRVVHVAQVDSTFMLGARDWTQVEVPNHASALGKVLLAYDVLPMTARLEPVTEATVTSLTELRRRLRSVVAEGWASTVDELEIGLCAVAVPVRGSDGSVVAALGVSGPNQRLAGRLDEVADRLKKRAEFLTSQLRKSNPKEGVA